MHTSNCPSVFKRISTTPGNFEIAGPLRSGLSVKPRGTRRALTMDGIERVPNPALWIASYIPCMLQFHVPGLNLQGNGRASCDSSQLGEAVNSQCNSNAGGVGALTFHQVGIYVRDPSGGIDSIFDRAAFVARHLPRIERKTSIIHRPLSLGSGFTISTRLL